jgi:hypothetical protein
MCGSPDCRLETIPYDLDVQCNQGSQYRLTLLLPIARTWDPLPEYTWNGIFHYVLKDAEAELKVIHGGWVHCRIGRYEHSALLGMVSFGIKDIRDNQCAWSVSHWWTREAPLQRLPGSLRSECSWYLTTQNGAGEVVHVPPEDMTSVG